METEKHSNHSMPPVISSKEEQFALIDIIAEDLSFHFNFKDQAHAYLIQKFGLDKNKRLKYGLDLIRSDLEGRLAKGTSSS
jgi:hypothetical protein